jgi:cytochrome c556
VPFATLKELMDSTVDPAADALWDAVAITATSAGITRHEPHTPEDWAAVRRHAITLIESMNLVILPGRHAAPPGTQPGLGELPPHDIELRIAQQRPAFVAFANGLQVTARAALEAIDHHDPEALLKAGGDIDAACEACHVTFWYPNQQYPNPSSPTR